jgi:hypothetical protein
LRLPAVRGRSRGDISTSHRKKDRAGNRELTELQGPISLWLICAVLGTDFASPALPVPVRMAE